MAKQEGEKPNILVIMGDDVGWMTPSCTTYARLKAGASYVNYWRKLDVRKTAKDKFVNTPNNVSLDGYGAGDLITGPDYHGPIPAGMKEIRARRAKGGPGSREAGDGEREAWLARISTERNQPNI